MAYGYRHSRGSGNPELIVKANVNTRVSRSCEQSVAGSEAAISTIFCLNIPCFRGVCLMCSRGLRESLHELLSWKRRVSSLLSIRFLL